MKRYIFFIVAIFNLSSFAMSSDNKCQLLRSELSEGLGTSNLHSKLLNEENLKNCFSAKMLITNNYKGSSQDNYTIFMDNLDAATMDIVRIMEISDQVDANLSQVNGSLKESQALVNTINFWQFFMGGEKYCAVVSGFGDDDHHITTIFKDNDTKIILMGAE